MGRHSTGAETIEGSFKICISFLKKRGLLTKGNIYVDTLEWSSNGRPLGKINILCDYTNSNDIYIRLVYNVTNNKESTKYDYKIGIVEAPTNLGKGKQLYFICPQTGNRCRQLYRAYGSPTWKSRKAYSYRLYYNLQVVSKLYRTTERYFKVENQLEKDAKKRRALSYAGKETKRYQLIKKKEEHLYYLDLVRWQMNSLPVSLQKLLKNTSNLK